MTSRYREGPESDYSHRFHAGNVGDVWKHLVLVEVLRQASAAGDAVAYVESHAGEGEYALLPTGEWTEGIGRLWSKEDESEAGALGRYVALCRSLGSGEARPAYYPGSPLRARGVLGKGAEMHFHERDPAACERLAAVLGESPTTTVVRGDGLAAFSETIRAAKGTVVALVDPPFTQKPDWTIVPDHVIAAARASTSATILLWYPVKSLTRPNAMIARCKVAGVSATVAELVTTPLEHQRQRLNGSGVLLIRPPEGAIAAIAAAAVPLGERCATREGVWSLRLTSW